MYKVIKSFFEVLNHCAVVWCLINLKTHESVTQTGLPGSYFMCLLVPGESLPTNSFIWPKGWDQWHAY